MARFPVLALALLASALAAEQVCAEGQCAEGGEEAALLQSAAAQKLAEVKAHSDDAAGVTCTTTPAKTCNDAFQYCYQDPACSAGGAGCISGTTCRFCGGSNVPQCPCPGGSSSCGGPSEQCLWSPGCSGVGCNADGKNQDCQFCDTGAPAPKCSSLLR
ncbi:unnamed protein product [Prorocentrum cordatum]|uniref:Subtilisin n=1 Tax=Prorocentrum cordatum TaxID=2364126 RepID=A0ABN9Y5W6_9DINO|nr:unnamed protein product [Polarella glacialis]